MKKTEKAVLIEGLRTISAELTRLADVLDGKAEAPAEKAAEEVPAAEVETPKKEAPPEPAAKAKTATFEEARAAMAEKARSGYKAEVKAILSAHGVTRLSEITSPEELGKIVTEAEEIGNG